MTLRCARLVVVPTTGPRSRAVAAPQTMGRAPKPPACEVSRMWRGCGVWTEAGASPGGGDASADMDRSCGESPGGRAGGNGGRPLPTPDAVVARPMPAVHPLALRTIPALPL